MKTIVLILVAGLGLSGCIAVPVGDAGYYGGGGAYVVQPYGYYRYGGHRHHHHGAYR